MGDKLLKRKKRLSVGQGTDNQEESSSFGDVFNDVYETTKDIGNMVSFLNPFTTGQTIASEYYKGITRPEEPNLMRDAIIPALEEPGRQFNEGVSLLKDNPIAGGVQIGNSLISLAATPFTVLDKTLRHHGFETEADVISYPFEKIAEGVAEGEKFIDKGLEKIGLDKKKQYQAIRYLMIDRGVPVDEAFNFTDEQLDEIAGKISQTNQALGQFLLPVVGKKGLDIIKGKIPKKTSQVNIDPYDGEVFDFNTGEVKPKALLGEGADFISDKYGNVYTKSDLIAIENARNEKTRLNDFVEKGREELKGLKGEEKTNLANQIKDAQEEVVAINESLDEMGFGKPKGFYEPPVVGKAVETPKGTRIKDSKGKFTKKNKKPQIFEANREAINDILNNDPSLSNSPKQIAKKLNTLVEKGELKKKVTTNSIKEIADEWVRNRPKPKEQTVKSTPIEERTAPNFFGKNTNPTIKDLMQEFPEVDIKGKTYDQVVTEFNKAWDNKRKGIQNATQEGKIEESGIEQYPQTETRGLPSETSGSDRPVESGKISQEKEVKGGENKVEEARGNLKNKGLQLGSGIDPTMYKDLAVIGLDYFKKGANTFAKFAKEMKKEFGKEISPHLLKIWAQVKETGKETKEQKKGGKVRTITEDELIKNREEYKKRHTAYEKGRESVKKEYESSKRFFKKILKPKDTRLYELDKSLYAPVKKVAFNTSMRLVNAETKATNWLKSISKIPQELRADIDLLWKNNKRKEIRNLLSGEQKVTFDKVTNLLDDLGKKLNIKEKDLIPDYLPRMVKDYDGLVKELYEKLGKDESAKNFVELIIKDLEAKLGDKPTVEQIANKINNTVRGYVPNRVLLSKFANEKARVLKVLDSDLAKYYHDFDGSLTAYINYAVENVGKREFFGKTEPNYGEQSIGRLITEKYLKEGKSLNPKDLWELKNILKSGFEPRGTHGVISTLKEAGYITRLFNWVNSLTQFGDLYIPLYEKPTRGAINLSKSLIRKNRIKLKQVGIDVRQLARELSTPSKRGKLSKFSSEWSLFKGIDALAKEVQINTYYDKFRNLALKDKLKKGNFDYEKFVKRFGADADAVVKEFKDMPKGELTGRQAFILWDLVDANQPYSTWATPESFHTSGQAQIFYQMKTFAIRRIDFILNETKRTWQDKSLPKSVRRKAIQNAFYLLGALTLSDGSTDIAKKLLKGQPVDIPDIVLNNLLGIVLLSKYDVNTIKKDGLLSAVFDKISPVTGAADDFTRDLIGLFNGKFQGKTLRNIPIFGEAVYNWIKGSVNKKSNSRR